MNYQIHHIHLINGEVITIEESGHLPGQRGLIDKFHKATPDDVITLRFPLMNLMHIPKRSILYILTEDESEAE